MLQILTYLLAFYVVIKGIEILQIALASPRQDRSWIIVLGVLVLGACIITAFVFVAVQDHQASSVGSHNLPSYWIQQVPLRRFTAKIHACSSSSFTDCAGIGKHAPVWNVGYTREMHTYEVHLRKDHRGIGISASRRHPRIACGSIRGVDCNACNADSTWTS